MSKQELKQKGFTIIEVVLVLAIAALIFLMVFIALPALQRNTRDQDRKETVGKVASAITTYQSNKRGQQPANGAALNGYIDGKSDTGVVFEGQPGLSSTASDSVVGNNYVVRVGPGSGAGAVSGNGQAGRNVIQVITGVKCNSTGDGRGDAASARSAAVMIKLENGNDQIFCQDV